MHQFDQVATEFLAQNRIAVAGVSATRQTPANGIYRTLRENGYDVFAVNPQAEIVEGDPCYPNMQAITDGVDGVIILTNPENSLDVVKDCVAAGVKRVWMHDNTFLPSSVSQEATELGRANGITVIDGGCPLMFFDIGHKCMKWMLGVMGRLPA
jgi:predicted CoA-binding protein